VLLVCLLSASLISVGISFYSSLSTAVWISIMEEKEKAKTIAACIAVIMAGLFVTGSIGGILFDHVSPVALLWVMIGIRIVNFVLLRRVSRTLSLPNSVAGD
jgi:predicted MFS family arabinose efflux permease